MLPKPAVPTHESRRCRHMKSVIVCCRMEVKLDTKPTNHFILERVLCVLLVVNTSRLMSFFKTSFAGHKKYVEEFSSLGEAEGSLRGNAGAAYGSVAQQNSEKITALHD